jgi:hypothetical protein
MALISSPEPMPVEVISALAAAAPEVLDGAVVAAGAVALEMVELI